MLTSLLNFEVGGTRNGITMTRCIKNKLGRNDPGDVCGDAITVIIETKVLAPSINGVMEEV